jgi:hypothetical protein
MTQLELRTFGFQRIAPLFVVMCVGIVGLWHFFHVLYFSVDLPYMDEWRVLDADQLAMGLRWEWLFKQHNEHRPLTSRIIIWVLYRFTGYDNRLLIALNFLIYAATVLSIPYIAQKRFHQISWVAVWSFCLFPFSILAEENLRWAYMHCLHIFCFTTLWGGYFLFHFKQSWKHLGIGLSLWWVSLFSLAGGIPTGVAFLVTYTVFKFGRARITPSEFRTKEYRQLASAWSIITVCSLAWMWNYVQPPYHPPLSFPTTLEFWRFWFNSLSLGFGVQTHSVPIGIVCFAMVMTPLIVVSRHSFTKGNPDVSNHALLWAWALAVFAYLAAAAIGRSAWWPELAKASRYSQIAMLLIPVMVLALGTALAKAPRAYRNGILVSAWLFCFCGYYNNWDFKHYERFRHGRLVALNCVRDYYLGIGSGECPHLSRSPIPPKLEVARKLNVSFYRKIMSESKTQ